MAAYATVEDRASEQTALQWIPGTPRRVPWTKQEAVLRTEAAIIQVQCVTAALIECGTFPGLDSGLRILQDSIVALDLAHTKAHSNAIVRKGT